MKPSLTLLPHRFAGVAACAAFILSGATVSSVVHAAPPEASQPGTAERAALPSTNTGQRAVTAVREAMSDAWEKSKDAPFRQREMVRERMKAAEASLDARILEWNAKKDAVSEDAKPAVAAAYKEVREAREVLAQKINALDNATEETWLSIKAELGTAWQRMTAAAADMAARLRS